MFWQNIFLIVSYIRTYILISFSMSIENSPKWVQEQVRKWLNLDKDMKTSLDALRKEALISFLKANKNVVFQKGASPENSAAHMVVYQKALNLLWTNIPVDGLYGPKTGGALKEFQQSDKWGNAIKSDGVPGSQTIAKLIKALEASGDSALAKVENKAPVERVWELTLTPEQSTSKKALTEWPLKDVGNITWTTHPANKEVVVTIVQINNKKLEVWVNKNGYVYGFIDSYAILDDKWISGVSGTDASYMYSAEFIRALNTLSKTPSPSLDLRKLNDKTNLVWSPTLTYSMDESRIYFPVESGGIGGYIRLEKADIKARKSVTHTNIKVWGKEYSSLTLTPKIIDDKIEITVASTLKSWSVPQAPITVDNHLNSTPILTSIKKISWLENATLQWLWFTVDNSNNLILPEGLVWIDNNKNIVKLADGYEVKGWKIVKKVSPTGTPWSSRV